MEIQKISQKPQAFSGINANVRPTIKLISPGTYEKTKDVAVKISKIKTIGDYDMIFKRNSRYITVQNPDPNPDLNEVGSSYISMVQLPTDEILVKVCKTPKNVWQKFLYGLGFAKTSEVVAKTNSFEDIFDAAALAFKNFGGC